VTVIKAEATRESSILRGEDDAEKTRVLGEAYSVAALGSGRPPNSDQY
jgi:hypothetical protein